MLKVSAGAFDGARTQSAPSPICTYISQTLRSTMHICIDLLHVEEHVLNQKEKENKMKLFKLISFLQFIDMSYERNVNTVEKKTCGARTYIQGHV